MKKKEFAQVRRHLGKTQVQMARLLGLSLKGIQSFEQGWRDVSSAAEQELLLLLGFQKAFAAAKPCWAVKGCPEEIRHKCPVWEFRAGAVCWLVNGTLCQGKASKNWEQKAKACRKCEVFRSVFDLPPGTDRPGAVGKEPLASEAGFGESVPLARISNSRSLPL